MAALLLALALQALVPAGDYKACTLAEAGSLSGPLPPRWGLEFYEVPNYLFLDQPGQYELKGYKVHWISGPLKGEAPGDFDPVAKTVRFHPNLPAGAFPIAALGPAGSATVFHVKHRRGRTRKSMFHVKHPPRSTFATSSAYIPGHEVLGRHRHRRRPRRL